MSPLSLILSFQFCIYLFLAIYVLIKDRTSRVHILFFSLCIVLAYWQFPAIFLYSTENMQTAWHCITLASPGIILSVPLSLHFCIELTGIIRFRRFWYLFLYLPGIFFAVYSLLKPFFLLP